MPGSLVCSVFVGLVLINVALVSAVPTPTPTPTQRAVPGEYIVQLTEEVPAQDVLEAVPGARIHRNYIIGSLRFVLLKTDEGTGDLARFEETSRMKEDTGKSEDGKEDPYSAIHDGQNSANMSDDDNRFVVSDLKTEERIEDNPNYDDDKNYGATTVIKLTTSSKATIKLYPNVVTHGFAPPPLDVYDEDELCYEQETERTYWGLTRMSHRDRPVFTPGGPPHLFNETGRCVTIYVMDSGVNVDHQTFGGRATWGYTVQDLQQTEGDRDLSGHGTHVAGLAGGRIHGSAKQANIVAVKVLDQFQAGTTDRILEGLEWIHSNINKTYWLNVTSVINLSLGLKDPNHNYDWLDAVIREIPAVTVAAAGNEDDDACNYVPARFDSVITVTATNLYDDLPNYSNTGPCVNLCAPGNLIRSASHRDNVGESEQSGTSMAAGFVSGVVARHLQGYTEQPTTDEMLHVLNETATKDKVTNAGIYNTVNLLLYASCDAPDRSADNLSDWEAMDCFPFLTTPTTTTTTTTTDMNTPTPSPEPTFGALATAKVTYFKALPQSEQIAFVCGMYMISIPVCLFLLHLICLCCTRCCPPCCPPCEYNVRITDYLCCKCCKSERNNSLGCTCYLCCKCCESEKNNSVGCLSDNEKKESAEMQAEMQATGPSGKQTPVFTEIPPTTHRSENNSDALSENEKKASGEKQAIAPWRIHPSEFAEKTATPHR